MQTSLLYSFSTYTEQLAFTNVFKLAEIVEKPCLPTMVIIPLLSTVTISGLELSHFRAEMSLLSGLTMSLSGTLVPLFSTDISRAPGLISSSGAGFGLGTTGSLSRTVTFDVALLPSTTIVILAEPSFRAVISPVLSTCSIDASELVH